MLKRTLSAAAVTLLALGGVTACSSKSDDNSTKDSSAKSGKMPTVRLMIGGIEKQIYLPYKLADQLGFYKKYGVNVELSTETDGGVGAEAAMTSGQVDMAGAWYNHAIDLQAKGKDVEAIVQLSGAPGEREMCTKDSGVHSAADFKGKTLGVTDLGSGTDTLTQFLAAKKGLSTKDYSRVAVGSGATAVAALQHGKVACVMTTQPTVAALEKKGVAVSAIDLATTAGASDALGGAWPAASILARTDWVNSHKDAVQRVVNAIVATMHWIEAHQASDIADKLPQSYVSNSLVTKADYIKALDQDKGQFLPDGIMPAGGPKLSLETEVLVGHASKTLDLSKTFTNEFALAANKLEKFPTTTIPADAAG